KLNLAPNPEVSEPELKILAILKNMAVLHPLFHIEANLTALKPVSLAISAEHLEQIMLIVLDNAVKYSPQNKSIMVRASVMEQKACIEVIDSGVGIPDSDMPYVMNRFFRVDKSRSNEPGGYGLGLAIAKRLVEMYNGTIALQSIEHKGTTVRISLPIR
ncbi:MAG: sensor histidine kinase, partial [Paenibacillus sp.]|nr:sensor histidine kinase [Paenibacillus sp.]